MTEKETITAFYTSFEQLDVEKMVALYSNDIIFEDPAFGVLKGDDAKNMWRMICKSAIDFSLTFSNTEHTAHWEATYTFSKTGRKVINKIDAKFEFKDGKISKHTDVFDLHKWASQALGIKGYILGGTSFFKKKLHQQTSVLLEKYKASIK